MKVYFCSEVRNNDKIHLGRCLGEITQIDTTEVYFCYVLQYNKINYIIHLKRCLGDKTHVDTTEQRYRVEVYL